MLKVEELDIMAVDVRTYIEELGRVEAKPSNPNRRAEISRVHGELNRGYKKGGWIQKATASIKRRGTRRKMYTDY